MRKIAYLLLQIALCTNTQAQVPDQRITEQDLQSFSEGRPMFTTNRDKINGFRIHEPEDSLHFEYFSFKPNKPEEKSFVQILYNGETRLLLKHKKQFIKADYQGAYSTGNKYDEYLDDKDYYLVKDDGVYRKIKLNKKSVLSALEDSRAALKEYALKHMINF